MLELNQGIMTFWAAAAASNFYVGIGGRLRAGRGYRGIVYPYSIFWQVDGGPEYFVDGGVGRLEHLTYQFDIFSSSNSPSEVLTLAGHCKSLFDDAVVTVTGYSLKRFEREANLLLLPEDDEGSIIQHYYLQYGITLEKN